MRSRLATVGLAAIVAGCGGGSDSGALGQRSIVQEVKPLRAAQLTQRDFARTRPGSPARAWLRYWSLAQQEKWGEAAEAYEPDLRAAIGSSRLLAALRASVDAYRGSKPVIASVRTDRLRAEIRYYSLAPGSAGDLTMYGLILRRDAGQWRISYSSMLDDALRLSAAQQELKRLGGSPTDPRVVAAGARAARLQSDYLQSRRLDR